MVYFWNSFLGNTIYEEEDCFNWTNCKDCGIYSTNVSIKEHKELLCPKRIQSCIYKSTGCPFKGSADTMMSHQASCQHRPGYNIIKCEFCGDPIHQPKFSKTNIENQKRCFNCRSEVKSRPVSALVRSSYSNPVQTGSDDEETEQSKNQCHEEIASSREKWKVMDYRRESTYDFLRW